MSGLSADALTPSLELWVDVDGLKLPLRRYGSEGRIAVLLLHGGNTNSRLFSEPGGGLIHYLLKKRVDVWTLDWRASADVVDRLLEQDKPLGGSVAAERELFSADSVAEKEIPRALELIHGTHPGRLAVMGFCLGAGSLSLAIARGNLEGLGIESVVLVTLGLFYEVTWDGWVKAEDFILERVVSSALPCRAVNAANPGAWPVDLAKAYDRWPSAWLSAGRRPIDELFRRLTFMYGQPYAREQLSPEFEERLVRGFFGSLHMGLYLHASQMVRRGFAARLNQPDLIDRERIGSKQARVPGGELLRSDLAPKNFANKRVTVIAGADDRLWHRDSIDLMYEWLRNRATPAGEPERHTKHVLPLYGHLDLFWGRTAETDVYPLIYEAIERREYAVTSQDRAEDESCAVALSV
jgi:cholesterol oxidase